MTEIISDLPNWIMILTFVMASVVFIMDKHMDEYAHVKDTVRFMSACVVLTCLYAMYIMALEKNYIRQDRYKENPITGITIRL